MNRFSMELKNLITDIISKQKQDLTGFVSNSKTFISLFHDFAVPS